MLVMAISITFFIYAYQKKLIKKKQELQAIRDEMTEQELNHAYEIVKAQDDERKELSTELHDSSGAAMLAVKLYASMLKNGRGDPQTTLVNLLDSVEAAQDANRLISHKLNSGSLKHFGLVAALGDLQNTISTASEVAFELSTPEAIDMPTEKAINLFRICQELTNNTMKHAKANAIALELAVSDEGLDLVFQDDGIGFDPEVVKKGLGLKGINTRIRPYNGKLDITSNSEGSTFRIHIPNEQET